MGEGGWEGGGLEKSTSFATEHNGVQLELQLWTCAESRRVSLFRRYCSFCGAHAISSMKSTMLHLAIERPLNPDASCNEQRRDEETLYRHGSLTQHDVRLRLALGATVDRIDAADAVSTICSCVHCLPQPSWLLTGASLVDFYPCLADKTFNVAARAFVTISLQLSLRPSVASMRRSCSWIMALLSAESLECELNALTIRLATCRLTRSTCSPAIR